MTMMEDFKLVAENNGALSWVTPEIDAVEMINGILNDKAKNQYVSSNQDTLRGQAEIFYKSIVTAVDPGITLEFEFVEDRG